MIYPVRAVEEVEAEGEAEEEVELCTEGATVVEGVVCSKREEDGLTEATAGVSEGVGEARGGCESNGDGDVDGNGEGVGGSGEDSSGEEDEEGLTVFTGEVAVGLAVLDSCDGEDVGDIEGTEEGESDGTAERDGEGVGGDGEAEA